MAGPKKVLVNRFSATRPRLWDSEKYDESLDRTHSDLVKFSVNDVDYERVHRRLREVASEATATLTSRYLTHGMHHFLSKTITSVVQKPNRADD